MPRGLRRYQQADEFHFITFSCYRRQQGLVTPQARRLLQQTLERVRPWYGLCVFGCVIMPEHSIWSQTFGYDAFGNIAKTGTSSFHPGYTSGNHVTGFTYDGMGNVTNDGANTYAYDAEGRPITVGGVQITYDALGRAIEQNRSGTYTQILYSPVGQKFALMNGSTVKQYFVPLAGGMQAVYNSSGLQYYRHSDWLGSSRFAATTSGAVYYDGAYAPFGENYAETGTTDRSFTGQTQDTTAGLYDFLLRQQSSAQGRWLVPDPAGLAAVDFTNPQTWNRYAYVANNPLNATDPLGLYCAIDPDGGLFHGCQQGGGLGGGDDEGDPYGLPPYGFPVFWPVGGGGGGHPHPPSGNPPPSPPSAPPPQPINFPNETNGLPNGFPTNPWGITGAIIPDGNCGDMGPCQFGFEGAVLLGSDPNWWQKFKQWLSGQYYGYWPKKDATVNVCSEVHGLNGQPMSRIDQAAGPNPYNPNGGQQAWIDFQDSYVNKCGGMGGVAVCRANAGVYGPQAFCQCCK